MATKQPARRETPAEIIARYFDDEVRGSTTDPSEVEAAIVAQVLAADSLEGTFLDASLAKWQDHLSEPFEVKDLRWNVSAFEGKLGVYAVVDALSIATGERATLGVGGSVVVAQLRKWQRDGWLPVKCRLEELPATAQGFHPLRLFPVEEPF